MQWEVHFRHNSWCHSANALKDNFLSKNALPMNIVTLGVLFSQLPLNQCTFSFRSQFIYLFSYLFICLFVICYLFILFIYLFIFFYLCMALRSLLSQPFVYACKSSIIGQLFFNRMTLNLLFTTTKILQNC